MFGANKVEGNSSKRLIYLKVNKLGNDISLINSILLIVWKRCRDVEEEEMM